MSDLLTTAIEMHQSGQWERAALLYQQSLAGNSQNADALHLLGVLRHQQGNHPSALDLIGRAITIMPGVALFHSNLAEVYRALGQFDRAVGCCRTAIRLQPNLAEAYVNLGLALRAQDKSEAAIAAFEEALRLKPSFAGAHNNLGDTFRVLGNRPKAVAHFRLAVQCDVNFAAAHSNLGQILLEQQELEDALLHCREAVRLQPNTAEAHNNLGNVLRERGQLAEARACYAEALHLNADLAVTFGNMGQALQEEGKLSEAIQWYEKALQIEPNSPRLHCYLASVFEEQENYEEATVRYELALKLDPEFAAAYNRLGWVRHEQGFFAEALERYKTALRLQPDFPAARSNLGLVLQELGDFAGSEKEYREVLRDYPRHAAALSQLATLLRGKLPAADREIIESRLAEPELNDAGRTNLLYGLAQVCDAVDEYEMAAAHLRKANALKLRQRHESRQIYDLKENAQFVDNLIAAFTPAFFERVKGYGLETRRPIFIVGLPRSGTTLTEQIIAGHSQVFGAGELNLARETFMSSGSEPTKTTVFEALTSMQSETVRRLGQRHLGQLRNLNNTAERVVDKMPDNYFYLGLLAVLFPKATFIHCRRDLRDIAVSCWITNFRHIRWANDPEHITARFREYQRLMKHWRAMLPAPVLEVDYEETVADLPGTARRLVEFCGLEWEPGCLAFHEGKQPVRTASVMQVRQPLYSRSVARWRNYESHLIDLFAALTPLQESTH